METWSYFSYKCRVSVHGLVCPPRVEFIEGMVVMTLLKEGVVGGLGEVALIVQEVQDSHRLAGNQVNHWQVVLWGQTEER